MAGVDIEAKGARRGANAEVNMIPFIDLLFMMLAFLLVTAVWTTHSRIATNANVPDALDAPVTPVPEERKLHVFVRADSFALVWKQGTTVLSEASVPKEVPQGDRVSFPALAKAVRAEWERSGGHKDPSDRTLDQAVLHSEHWVPYRELAAVMDAVHQTKRDVALGARLASVPAMNLTFAVK